MNKFKLTNFDELCKELKGLEEFPQPSFDFDEECKAVVAFADADTGVVIFHTGGGLDFEFYESSLSKNISDLPFDSAKDEWPEEGIWIWEGHLKFIGSYYGDDVEELLQGSWREPTEEEWKSIKKNESPWVT